MRRRGLGGVCGRGALVVLVVLLGAAAGCPPARVGVPPRDAEDALLRISDNLSGLGAPLICKGLVSFRFRDESGNMRRFIAHPTTIVFRSPQSLYFDIKDAIGGSVARIGSNNERYWIWIDVPDSRRLMWGEWSRVAELPPERIPLPPGDLLDALCLRPPGAGVLSSPFVLRRGESDEWDQRLVQLRMDAVGRPVALREVRLDPEPPYQPIRILDRGPDGKIVMDAEVGQYRRVGDGGPFIPRRYVVTWPVRDAELRLDVGDAVLRPEMPDVFEFPRQFSGRVDALDDPPLPPLSPDESAP